MEQDPRSLKREARSIKEIGLTSFTIKNLLLHSDDPIIDKELRSTINDQFESLSGKERGHIENVFGKFLLDSGLNRFTQMSPVNYARVKKVSSQYADNVSRSSEKVEIYNRAALIDIAEQAILNEDPIALINLDIQNLRGADLVGYAEHLLRRLAKSMLQASADFNSEDLAVVPVRYGGDEFKFLLIYKGNNRKFKFSESELGRIFSAVSSKYRKRRAYYSKTIFEEDKDNGKLDIRTTSVDYADLPGFKQAEIVTPDKKVSRRILVEYLRTGKLPELVDLEDKRENASYSQGLVRSYAAWKKNNFDTFFTNSEERIDQFFERHKEFKEEKWLIDTLRQQGRNELAALLVYSLKHNLDHPYLGQRVLKFPDYIIHLGEKSGGQIVYEFFPWLKIFNNIYGMSQTDTFIKEMHANLEELALKNTGGVQGAKGADFSFFKEGHNIFSQFAENPVQIVDSGSIDISKTPFAELKKIYGFFGVPTFFVVQDFNPKLVQSRAETSTMLSNMESGAQMVFIRWLNDLFFQSPTTARKIVDFYLSVRREDRLMELKYWLKKTVKGSKISPDFLETIIKLR